MGKKRIHSKYQHNYPEHQSILHKPLSDSLFCAVDVETSGLSASSRVVEIGAALFDLEGNLSTFQSLVNPLERISPRAYEIHGISNEMVSDAPSAAKVIPHLLDFMDGSVLVAHNAFFDVKMLSNEMERADIPRPSHPVICTVKLAQFAFAELENFRLATLVRHLKINCQRLHRGLDDALAAMEVFQRAVTGFSPETKVRELPGFEGTFAQICSQRSKSIKAKGIPEELPDLAEMRIPIEMVYDSQTYPQPTMVTPVRVYKKAGRQYLLAYCHRDGINKTYRIDRILSFRKT